MVPTPSHPARPAIARATFWVMLSAICFGTTSIFTILATDTGVALKTVLLLRYALAAPMLLIAAGGPRRLAVPPGRRLPLFLVGGGGQGLITLLSLSSLRYIPVATLGFLFYTYPAWVALFAVLRGSERVDARKGLALFLSLAGVALMVGAPGAASLHPVGFALALGAAIVYGLFIPVIERLQAGTAPAVAAVHVIAGAALFFLVAAALSGDLTLFLPARAWAAIVGFAFVATTLAFTTFLAGLPVLGPIRTAIVSTIEPFWIALLGYFVLGQPLTAGTLAGGALIAAAVVLLHLPARPIADPV